MPENSTAADHYSTLGLESGATAADIRAQIEITRERLGLLKKIPKKREEAELRLAHLMEIEGVLLNPSARVAYDAGTAARGKAASQSGPAIDSSSKGASCQGCGAALTSNANFCDECGVSTRPGTSGTDDSIIQTTYSNEGQETTVPEETKLAPPSTATREAGQEKAILENKPESRPQNTLRQASPLAGPSFQALELDKSGKGRMLFGVAVACVVLAAMIWIVARKPLQTPTSPTVVTPPVAGQVTDLRAPQVSLLNQPTFTPSPTASWDTQNVSGTITLKSVNNALSFVYPDGSQFAVNSGLFPASSAGSAVFDDNFGTIAVTTNGLPSQQASPSTWQVQFQASEAKDINGDGFPEIVLSDYSGGAHCCTTITVVSLRPHGPFIIFSEDLGSDGALFKDIDGDGRREIRYDHLFEYALGDFAHGTFGVPVICSAGNDGVYRVNTRAFAQLLSNEYEAQMRDHQKATYDDAQVGAEEQDRDIITLFFSAYAAGRRVEGFDLLQQLRPLNADPPSNADPLAILEDALKKVAPEVLQEAEWLRIKSGQAASSAQQTSNEVPQVAPPTASEQHAPPSFATQAPPANVGSTSTAPSDPKSLTATSGTLHYQGPPVHFGESISFAKLPGSRLKFTFDHQSWQPLISRQADGTQTLTLRSLKRDDQMECEVEWVVIM